MARRRTHEMQCDIRIENNRIKKVIVRKSFAISSTSYRISESQIEVPNLMIKNQNWSKTIAKAYFFFWSLRGPGKLIRDDLCCKTFTLSLLYLFFGTSKWDSEMHRTNIAEKNFRNSSKCWPVLDFRGGKIVSKKGAFLKVAIAKWRRYGDAIDF